MTQENNGQGKIVAEHRMIPVQFFSTDANGNEKQALIAMLEAGGICLVFSYRSLIERQLILIAKYFM